MKLNFAILSLSIIVAVSVTAVAASSAPSPHGDQQRCEACHVATPAELKDPSVSGARKKQLSGGPVRVCTGCHTISMGHGVGKKPSRNIHGLPMAADGTIACAVTCHDVHLVKPEAASQKRFFLRLSPQKLCSSCHDE